MTILVAHRLAAPDKTKHLLVLVLPARTEREIGGQVAGGGVGELLAKAVAVNIPCIGAPSRREPALPGGWRPRRR